MKISVLIPTINAGNLFVDVLQSINCQSINIEKKIIVDSGSIDSTKELAKLSGFDVIEINKEEFRHGATRQQLVDLSYNCDVCVFLTQDAILASKDSIQDLINIFFDDVEVGLAYGRQIPNKDAKVLESHARIFNYPTTSNIRTIADKQTFGFKTIFCSNSFAAYRVEVLKKLGGFPSDTIMGEDTIVASKILIAGFKVAYVSTATVYHSHNYTLVEEFKRYFDTGVFHAQHVDLKKEFGSLGGEGFRYVKSEIKYVIKNKVIVLPYLVLSTLSKWLGYKIGINYKFLNIHLIKKISMHKNYWDRIV